jgi:hypothetical protein
LSKSRVESLKNDAVSSISVKAIESLAAGLRISPDVVAEAAMVSMGFGHVTRPSASADALAGDPTLSEPMRRVLLAALEAAKRETPPRQLVRHADARRLRRARLVEDNATAEVAADKGDGLDG